jgi:2,3-bisphosphoglycerate-dependent phosphoglycerate mutase
MKRLYLIRHCSATGQAADAPLSREGQAQAERLADFLMSHEIERIVSSPFLRAQQTIEPLATRLKLEIRTDARLAERVLSRVPLVNWMDDLKKTFDDLDLTYECGESSRTAMNRAVEVVKEILSHDANTSAVVTHGNLMTLLLKYFDDRFGFEDWKRFTNPDVFVVTVNGLKATIERIWASDKMMTN